jgi:asparagine synthase (glutamine-hydrolysing)
MGSANDALARRMVGAIKHRGPDEMGFCVRRNGAMGSARLSLVDLLLGGQPVYDETGEIAVCFNGEIYNYRELRETLLRKGHTFRSESDTEVIVHLYEEHGERCVDHLHGMFAFAILNGARLFLARDRLGIKPLYYASLPEAGLFLFASEVKALLQCPELTPRVDTEALADTVLFGHPVGASTHFENVRSLPPGHTLTVALDGAPQVGTPRRYYEFPAVRSDLSIEGAIEALSAAFTRAVTTHLSADVDVGLTLSGGIDSTVMALFCREQRRARSLLSFTVAGDASHSDLLLAARVARMAGTEHVPVVMSFDDYVAAVPGYVAAEECPTSLHVLPFYVLCQAIGKRVKACLIGEGADELFGGYPEYLDRSDRQVELPERLKKVRSAGLCPSPEALEIVRRFVEARGVGEYLEAVFHANLTDALERNHLHPIDKCAMASSVEARVPYLDDGVMELVTSLPLAHRVRPDLGIRKYLLRRLCLERFGADTLDIVLREKQGLPTAGARHLQRLIDTCEQQLPDDYLQRHEFGRCFTSKFSVFVFDLFHEIFFVHRGRHARVGPVEEFLAARAGRATSPTASRSIEPRRSTTIAESPAAGMRGGDSGRRGDEDAAWRSVQVLLGNAVPAGGWMLQGFDWLETEGDTRGLVVVYGHADEVGRLAVLLEPSDASKRSYARSERFNISYLREWDGQACRFDEGLLAWCVAALRGIEGGPADRA